MSAGFHFDTPVQLDAEQEVTERFRAAGRGRYVQVRFTSSRGRVTVRNVVVKAQPGLKRRGVLA